MGDNYGDKSERWGVLHKIKRKENKEELVTEKDLGAQGR